MAAGFAITSEGGQYYNGKMTVFVVLSCIVAATGGLIFGYDIGISVYVKIAHYAEVKKKNQPGVKPHIKNVKLPVVISATLEDPSQQQLTT